MNSKDFVFELNSLSPSKEEFALLGYDTNMIDTRLKSYECTKYISPIDRSFDLFDDSILTLLSSYNCSNIEIGQISFNREIIETKNYYIIGIMEIDLLILNKITLEIQIIDYVDHDNVMYNCASNSASFLSAILLCAEFFSKRVKNPKLAMDIDFTAKYLLFCVEKAGGEKYSKFYKVLLGYD